MGCDFRFESFRRADYDFNPRIPYGMRLFRVTLSIRHINFNPRIPYGMRLFAGVSSSWLPADFNPRIPYGMRHAEPLFTAMKVGFQSTHPVWDATHKTAYSLTFVGISIHASRMGCDTMLQTLHRPSAYFNPRIPYGMRLREWTLHSIIWKFLPALRADYIADIPEHLSVCIFGL